MDRKVSISYDDYFRDNVRQRRAHYLRLANETISPHRSPRRATTIAEECECFPGLGASTKDGGADLDYRLQWARQIYG